MLKGGLLKGDSKRRERYAKKVRSGEEGEGEGGGYARGGDS